MHWLISLVTWFIAGRDETRYWRLRWFLFAACLLFIGIPSLMAGSMALGLGATIIGVLTLVYLAVGHLIFHG
jgi:hypothetical protein